MKQSYKSGPRFGPNAWSWKDVARKQVEEVPQQVLAKEVEPVLQHEVVEHIERPEIIVEQEVVQTVEAPVVAEKQDFSKSTDKKKK